ncbi:MAG: methylated-DNA--[protein]-cysteine S-methyltransferase [Anaerotardibacter sp.]
MQTQKPSYYLYQTPFGRLTIVCDGASITHILFGAQKLDLPYKPSSLTTQASTQILEYLAGKRKEFDLPLNPQGTEFQKRVWDELKRIPYGETRTYKDIAEALGNPKAMRAVGSANNKNPIPIIIPCHRVIGINGNLVGYSGGLAIKEMLLSLEANHKD